MAKEYQHIQSPLTAHEVKLLLDYIAAKDDLLAVIQSGVKGYINTPEWRAAATAQDVIWQYADKTGRAINAKVGLYAGNVWD